MIKLLSREEIREKYAGAARWYDVWTALLEAMLLGGLRRRLLCHAQGNVLEVGIGTGLNLKHYPQKCEITGLDYTPEMLEKAKERAERLGRKVNFIQGDAQRLPFKARSFDTVVDTFCLCTYPNAMKVLYEMKRVCKRDGHILLLEHGKSSSALIENLQRWRAEKHYQSIGCRLLLNHEALVKKAGFKIVTSERRFFGIFYVIKAKN
ncbi:MAG: class I SAM-dependent methyltransferase [Nanoarchaeota archaeon]